MRSQGLAVVGHAMPAPDGSSMTATHALAAMAALGQATRMQIFRLLMRHEPKGLPAGGIAEQIGCPQNTLSSHLSILARSGLVRGERQSRFIIYRANVDGMRELLRFLVMDCCDGHPELCGLVAEVAKGDCCAPSKQRKARRK